jgi:signal transduction histidine kinase
MFDIARYEELERALQESETRNRALLGQVINAQENERARVSRELHDAAGQSLSCLLLGLRAVLDATSLEAAKSHAQELHRIAGQTLDEVQRLARALRPSTLDDFGLVPALERCADDWRQFHHLDVRIKAAPIRTRRFPSAIETTLYRIAQEALTNTSKHARANTVLVSFEDLGSVLRMTIRDDGQGFNAKSLHENLDPSRHLGLSTMRERAALVGGSFTVESEPGRGTKILVELPSQSRSEYENHTN